MTIWRSVVCCIALNTTPWGEKSIFSPRHYLSSLKTRRGVSYLVVYLKNPDHYWLGFFYTFNYSVFYFSRV